MVITGASTGIGRACALRLDQRGWRVFAGVRREEDAASLRAEASDRLMPVFIDVTNVNSIREACNTVAGVVGNDGLAGLINNAGMGLAGPVEFVSLDDFRWQLEVNVIGQIAVTQAFFSMLRTAQGRIVMMGSVSGKNAFPFYSPYASSKFALEAVSDALRVEVRPWKMHVSIIEPGAIATPIWDKGLEWVEQARGKYPEEAFALYGRVVDRMLKITRRMGERGIQPDSVAKAVEHALTARRPKARYVVGWDAHQGMLINRLPTWFRDWIISKTLRQE